MRAIGFVPTDRLVEVGANAADEVIVDMVALPPTLEAARVVASRAMRDDLVIAGIRERNRVAAGTMFLPGNPWLRDASYPADVVRAARGFMYKNPTMICARLGCVTGGCTLGADQLPPGPSERWQKTIALYVDGERLRGGLAALNDFVPVKDILAIETYPDVMSAPPIWRSTDACAVIAVWARKDP